MTKLRTWYVIALLTCLGSVTLYTQQVAADSFHGATYLITIKDATTGAFASRGVITLHGDRTLSAIDSAQGGPDFFFSSQLGAWEPDGGRRAVGRTLDFNFPPNNGVARLDYTFKFSPNSKQVTGTITLTIFPLQEDPLNGEGIVAGEFTFDGTLVRP